MTDIDKEAIEETAERYVTHEVLANYSGTMTRLLEIDPNLWEEVENMDVPACPHCGEVLDAGEDEALQLGEDCPYCKKLINEFDYRPREPFEWWLVSTWLARQLLLEGEVMWEGLDHGSEVWGRCTTGQAIFLDGIMQRIASRIQAGDHV